MARPGRRHWIDLLVLAALALTGLLSLRFILQPERLSTYLLQQLEQATGLEIQLQQPADIGWWPDLHIELQGLSVRAPDQPVAFLRVARADLALPWSSLQQEHELRLSRLRLIGPELDIPAMQTVLASRSKDGPPAPLVIPQLDTPLQLREARILGDGWALENLRLDLPQLHPDRPTRLDAGAALVLGEKRQLFALQLATTPGTDGSTLRLAPFELSLVIDGPGKWRPQIVGTVQWNVAGLLELELQTRMANWPASWPELPLPAATGAEAFDLSLHYNGDTGLHGRADFSVARGEDGARGSLVLNELLDWLGQEHPSPLPPLDGEVEIPRLQYGGIEASGVRLRFRSEPDDGG